MTLTLKIAGHSYSLPAVENPLSLPELDDALTELAEAWRAAPDKAVAIVDGGDPDATVRAIVLLWARQIRPTVVRIKKGDFVHPQESAVYFEPLAEQASYFLVWKKPVEGITQKVIDLIAMAPPVSAKLQAAWTKKWLGSCDRQRRHRALGDVGAARFLAGAWAEGLMDESELAAAARSLGDPRMVSGQRPKVAPRKPSTGQRILLAEDQPYWELLLRPVLRADGFELEVRTSIRQTFDLLSQRSGDFSALILDLHYDLETDGGEMSPQAIVRRIADIAPQLPIVIFSSNTDARVIKGLRDYFVGYFFKHYEEVGRGDPAGSVVAFRKAIRNAVTQGGPQAARVCARKLTAPAGLRSMLEEQAKVLNKPSAALLLNVGLNAKTRRMKSKMLPVEMRREMRNYGAHPERTSPPSIYDALACHLQWVAAGAEATPGTPLTDDVVMTLRAFARSTRDPVLEQIANVASAGTAARSKAVAALKTAVDTAGYELMVTSVTDPKRVHPRLRAMKLAMDYKGSLPPIETAVQCLLLAQLGALCR